jgi:hypothetical protein
VPPHFSFAFAKFVENCNNIMTIKYPMVSAIPKPLFFAPCFSVKKNLITKYTVVNAKKYINVENGEIIYR